VLAGTADSPQWLSNHFFCEALRHFAYYRDDEELLDRVERYLRLLVFVVEACEKKYSREDLSRLQDASAKKYFGEDFSKPLNTYDNKDTIARCLHS
jgi:hypothetical protein